MASRAPLSRGLPSAARPYFPAIAREIAYVIDDQQPSPFDLFDSALAAYRRGDVPDSVLLLRRAFFENLYIAPILIGESPHAQAIWYPSAESELPAAREYVKRYGLRWREASGAVTFLEGLWNDPLVRAELRTFLNLSKNMLLGDSRERFESLFRERSLILSPERLRRTGSEISARLGEIPSAMPELPPRLGLVMLASRDPGATVDFYRKLLGVEPREENRIGRGYAEFDFAGVHFAVHGLDRASEADPYRLGPRPRSLGWGALFVFTVADLDRHLSMAASAGIEILDSDLSAPGRRSIVVKDPSGYLVEMTEEKPEGLDRGA